MNKSRFYWEKKVIKNLEFIVLGYQNYTNPEKSPEIWVLPSRGSNMCRFSLGNKNIIDFEMDLLVAGDYTGTPVLYPTPNRVRNGIFRYQGTLYNQIKRGEPVFEHGLVHDEIWEFSEPVVENESVYFKTWIDFKKSSPLFEAFPFQHRLLLEFRLQDDGVKITYQIENRDEQDLPFGFGLHPYFMKLSGDENTTLSLPAGLVMDYTSDLLPTGRLIEVDQTIYDLKTPVKIGALDLDHVFTGIATGEYGEIEYRNWGMKLTLAATEDFSHLVVYSPRGKNYFCVENQTCSTDAHNLYDRGFVRESGLKFVATGKVHRGFVQYTVKEG